MTQGETATDTDGIARFPYHRSVGPMIGVLLGIAIAETLVLHIVALAVWGRKVALVLGALDLSVIVTLIRLLRSFKRWPVTIEAGRLVMRAGHMLAIPIEADNIAGLRSDFDRAAIKRRDVANLALIAWPNVLIDLHRPIKVRRRRIISHIAHRLDDPAAFHVAVAQLERGHGDRCATGGTGSGLRGPVRGA
jgi:hypothetical protein